MIGCVSPPSGGELRILGLDPVADGPRDPGPARRGAPDRQPRPGADRPREPDDLRALSSASRARGARQRAAELLDFVQLTERADDRVEPLSGGMKRRLTIARALINEPDLVLLDEPTTGLDPQARHLVWERLFRLKQRGVTLVLTTHYMDEAEQLCDRLVVMDAGRIVAEGSPRDLIAATPPARSLELRFGDDAPDDRTPDKLAGHRRAPRARCPTGCCSTPHDGDAAIDEVHGRGVTPRSVLVRRCHAGGRVPEPHRPDAGGLMDGTLAVFEPRDGLLPAALAGLVFSSFILPLLFVLSIGIGVGGYVRAASTASATWTIVPGLLASTAFQMAVGESTFPVLGDFKWSQGLPRHPGHAGAHLRHDRRTARLHLAPGAASPAVVFLGGDARRSGPSTRPGCWRTPVVCARLWRPGRADDGVRGVGSRTTATSRCCSGSW